MNKPAGALLLFLAACAAAHSGCGGPTSPPESNHSPPEDFWEVSYLGDRKIGRSITTHVEESLDGETVLRITNEADLPIMRGAQRVDQKVRATFWETADGDVRRFDCTVDMINSKQATTGIVRGEEAVLTTTIDGRSTTQTILWPRGTKSQFGQLEDLRRNPLAAGQSRQLTIFMPIINRTATAYLTGVKRESTPLTPGVRRDLLRVEMRAQIEGGPAIDTTLWLDESGEVIKTLLAGSGISSVRTSREIALADDQLPAADINAIAMVAVSPALVSPAYSTFVRYRLRLEGGDAAAAFPSGEYQTVRRLDDGSAEATVMATRPDSALPEGFIPTPPTAAERLPSSLVQSDDPLVVQMAAEAAGDVADPWTVAVRLESFVHAKMNRADFSPAFADAAETARSLTGDCTEHAVLLCAMLRARDIPARVALGLVYVEGSRAFGFHLWTEAFINGRWMPLDATLGRGGTSAAYLKVGHAGLAGVDAYAALLPVISIIGKLKIEVLEQR